jgi:hypothetical protein
MKRRFEVRFDDASQETQSFGKLSFLIPPRHTSWILAHLKMVVPGGTVPIIFRGCSRCFT